MIGLWIFSVIEFLLIVQLFIWLAHHKKQSTRRHNDNSIGIRHLSNQHVKIEGRVAVNEEGVALYRESLEKGGENG